MSASATPVARLTSELVIGLKINVLKGPLPLDEIPTPKRTLTNPPTIEKEIDLDAYGYRGDGCITIITEYLDGHYTTIGDNPTDVSVACDASNTTLKTTEGYVSLPCHCRFMLKPRVDGAADAFRPPPSVICVRPPNLEIFKLQNCCAPEVTESQYCQALLAAMAARVPPNTLVQVLRPADESDIILEGDAGVDRDRTVGHFVRTTLKVPAGAWAARHTKNPNGINAYEEVLDFTQLPVLNSFVQHVIMNTPGPCGRKRNL